MRLVWGTVTGVSADDERLQRLKVALDDDSAGEAICFPHMTGRCAVDDRVLLNTTAVDLSLGTGGAHFVVTREGRDEGVVLDHPSGGHIMKLRYTPFQTDVLSVEEQGSPHHETMRRATSLMGLPVVCCGLHSQVPLVAAAVKHLDAGLRVAYVMTDSAALSLAMSDNVRRATAAGLIDTTFSCGQAFGGQFEAVNTHSALLAARHVARADVAIVAIGPGVVGTATPFGHGGIAQGEALNAVSSLDGRPIAVLRASFADARERHRGVSHHTLVALGIIASAKSYVPIPALCPEHLERIEEDLESAGLWDRHVPVRGLGAFEPDTRGIEVTTMGRGVSEDPAFFSAAYAAGELGARFAHDEHSGVHDAT